MSDSGQFGPDFKIDICLCIDKTASMRPLIDTVKRNALNLCRDIQNHFEAWGKHVNRIRVRVICFGDCKADKEPMIFSPFLTLPEDNEKFESFVNGIQVEGGGDEPEDALEALAYAMRSDWCEDSWRRRHIIAMFTDAPAHELGFGKNEATYPKTGMPKDFAELSAMWGDEDEPGIMNYSAKRLILFAPDVTYWHTIAKGWENTIIRSVERAAGLSDITYQIMLDAIFNRV